MSDLKKIAPNIPLGYIFMLFSMFVFSASMLKGAIVSNGDFEQDKTGTPATAPLTNWSPTNSDASPTPQTTVKGQDPFYAYNFAQHTDNGSIAANFFSNTDAPANSMASISQTLTTDPTKSYNLQLWVANPYQDPNARANLFSVIWNGNAVKLSDVDPVHFAAPSGLPTELNGDPGTYVVKPNSPWFVVNINNLAPGLGLSTNLVISGQNNNLATLVDDVAVTETPEPSSVVLLLAGTALIGVRRRRQQKIS